MSDAVLGTPRFRAKLQELADEAGRPVEDLRKEAEGCLKEMQVRPGRFSVAGWDRFCRWLSRAYRVDYRAYEVEHLRDLNRGAALIFLPNHRSYLDPMVLRSALMAHGFPPNNVLGGANLALWPFSAVGQRNGIVFIRREIKGDPVYRAVLKAYLGSLLADRQNLEWYIEGGRTRTGKLRPPKLGVLSYVMDAFALDPTKEVLVVPVSVVYDQQHEVSAISDEELGGRKKPESLSWAYDFAKSQSRRLGRAYLRFGEPLSMGDALALTADEDGNLRPRLAVPKVAFELANRINTVTPITPGALVTMALLDNGDRAITVEEGRAVLAPMLAYIARRGLPVTEPLNLDEHGPLREALQRLESEGVVSVYKGGEEYVFSIPTEKQLEAAFYRNTIIHFFLARAVTELAALEAAQEHAEDIPGAVWDRATRLKDLLKFEFFWPSTVEFARQIETEAEIMIPGWQQRSFTADSVLAELPSSDLLLAHRIIGPFFEAYHILFDELADHGDATAEEKSLVERALAVAKQRYLQRQLPTAESISRDYFRNAVLLAQHYDLMDGSAPDIAERRRLMAEEIVEIATRLDAFRKIAQQSGQPVLPARAPLT
jgi:glycerol-3-phosphate O-acyltransferase